MVLFQANLKFSDGMVIEIMQELPISPIEEAPPDVPWTPHDVAWGLVAFVTWIMVVVLVGEVSEAINFPIDASVVVILGTSLLLVPAWYFTIYKYGAGWGHLGLRGFSPSAVGFGCGLMIISLLFNMVYAAFLAIFNLQIQPDIDAMFNGTRFPLVLLFGGAVIAPLVEEIFFRGFVFAGLRNKWDWKIAALISASVFAIAHVIPTSILPIFILGLIFAFLYQISGSIWPAILMHMLTNTVSLSAAYAISQGWIPPP